MLQYQKTDLTDDAIHLFRHPVYRTKPGCSLALGKLLDKCDADDYLNYEPIPPVCLFIRQHGADITTALEKAVIREKEPQEWDEQSVYLRTRLGKYKLSDILGFNRKGKNHF
jgi:hypothetical protein